MQFLIKYFYQNIYQQFFFNRTILFSACKSGNYDLVKYLIELGVYNLKDKDIQSLFLMKLNIFIFLYCFLSILQIKFFD